MKKFRSLLFLLGVFICFISSLYAQQRDSSTKRAVKERYMAVVENYLSQMTLQDKVGQLIISYPPLYGKKKISIGGVILLGGILKSKKRIIKRVNYLQKKARIPLFIAVDMEGGRINPLRKIREFRGVPSHLELSKKGPEVAYKWGYKLGLNLKKLGINCNLAPVLDLAKKGFMFRYKRTFGGDPLRVVQLAGAFLRGMGRHKIISITKHFPGYGSIDANSDHQIMTISRSKREVLFHLKPFILLKEQFHGVMMANIAIRQFGPKPALFSKKIIAMAHKYNWLTVTDDLCSKSILRRYGGNLGAVVKDAFLAGNDILLMTCLLDILKKEDDPRFVLSKLIKKRPGLQKTLDNRVKKILLLKLQTFWRPPLSLSKRIKETL